MSTYETTDNQSRGSDGPTAPDAQTMIEIRATMELSRRWDITGREAEQYLERIGYMEAR